jgi:hypothetical protein
LLPESVSVLLPCLITDNSWPERADAREKVTEPPPTLSTKFNDPALPWAIANEPENVDEFPAESIAFVFDPLMEKLKL